MQSTRNFRCFVYGVLFIAFIAPLPVSNFALGQESYEIVAMFLDPEPGANGNFLAFGPPVLNDAGDVAFDAILNGTAAGFLDNRAIYAWRNQTLDTVARMGSPTPEGNGLFDFVGVPVLNNGGQIAFSSTLRETSGGFSDDRGVYRADPDGSLFNMARAGDTAPDGNGQYSTFGVVRIDDSGIVDFWSILANTQDFINDRQGIFDGDGLQVNQVVRAGDPAPFPGVMGRDIGNPAVNGIGDVVFYSGIMNSSVGIDGIFIAHANGMLNDVAVRGEQLPGSTDRFNSFGEYRVNNLGQVVFAALIENAAGAPVGRGVFLCDDGAIVELHRTNAPTLDFGLSDNGQVVFYTGSTVFRSDGNGTQVVASQGDLSPDGNGNFLTFDSVAINDSGMVVFRAILDNTSNSPLDDLGIFVTDGESTTQIARQGNPLAGLGIVVDLSFDRLFGFNNEGQLAFLVSPQSSGGSIVLWSPASTLLGDVNLDGVVNLLDVGPFIDRLNTGVFQQEADINQDGVINLLDVGPFVELLSQ